MEILYRTKKHDIATVFIAGTEDGRMIEFVESTQPPLTRDEKWVLIVSTLFGCPVACRFCDAGGDYGGILSEDQIIFQIDSLIRMRYSGREIDCGKFKIQFARVGEPAFNPNVLSVLEKLPERYRFRNFIPSVSTIAPFGCESFFERLLDIRRRLYPDQFQLQFSLHSTDRDFRDELIPVKKWDFRRIAEYGARFKSGSSQKISLNFALSTQSPLDEKILREYFDPEIFLLKITPINPTYRAKENRMESLVQPGRSGEDIIGRLKSVGYDVILSIGEWAENRIGSNCGQYIWSVKDRIGESFGSYSLGLEPVTSLTGELGF